MVIWSKIKQGLVIFSCLFFRQNSSINIEEGKRGKTDEVKRHEERFSTQRSFKEQTVSLGQVIIELGNPFLDGSDDLLARDTWNVLDESVANMV